MVFYHECCGPAISGILPMPLLPSFFPVVFAALVAGALEAQEWPRFRGPNGAGVGEANVPSEWTEEDFAWRVKLPGIGHSSPVIWKEKLFLTAGDEESGTRIVL